MDDVLYWIWLQNALGYGNLKFKKIKELYGTAKDFFNGGEYEWKLSGILRIKDIESLKKCKTERAYNVLNSCQKLGYNVIGLSQNEFPGLLYQIDNPPAVLYVKGDISCVENHINVAVVGTRKASEYGIGIAEDLAYNLAKKDITIVSGGAVGIDLAAHEGALKAGGKTVCVLGCGINYPYLSSKEYIREEISKNGAVVSEYPPGFPASRYTFPVRNRIISGLSSGTVVVEAGEKSGSLITANIANEQNRDVYVFPPHPDNFENSGSVSLIRDGAMIISGAEDILNEYTNRKASRFPRSFRSTAVSKKAFEFKKSVNSEFLKPTRNENIDKISPEGKKIYNLILKGKIHIDEITSELNLPPYKVLSLITELEIAGVVRSLAGNYYQAI